MKHKPVKVSKLFKVSEGKVERAGKLCPRCGEGTFMAKHKNRYYCGRCHYTEFLNKPKEKIEKLSEPPKTEEASEKSA